MNDHAARVASEVVNGLKGAPVLLALLVLNMVGVGAALWFLSKLTEAQAARYDLVLKACLPGAKP